MLLRKAKGDKKGKKYQDEEVIWSSSGCANEHLELKPRALLMILLLASRDAQQSTAVLSMQKRRKNIYTKMRRKRRQEFLANLKKNFNSVKHIFGSRGNMFKYKSNLADVFGQNVLVRVTPGMLFYSNRLLEFSDCKVIRAHADGRFADVAGKWHQTFELKLVLRKDNQQKVVTFAFALLKGSSEQSYREFFKAVFDMHPPMFPLFIADFEISIQSAVIATWKNTRTRGCFFHYAQNVLKMQAKIERVMECKVSEPTVNFLRLLPFLFGTESYLWKYICRFKYADEELCRNVAFKLVIYVYQTYVKKLDKLFVQDLDIDIVRTNNISEASNSTFSKGFTMKPRIEDLADHVAVLFKQDLVRPWDSLLPLTEYDQLLLEIQRRSERNQSKILAFCAKVPEICQKNASIVLNRLRATTFYDPVYIIHKDVKEAIEELDKLSDMYRKYSQSKRKEFRALRKTCRGEGLTGIKPRSKKSLVFFRTSAPSLETNSYQKTKNDIDSNFKSNNDDTEEDIESEGELF